MRTVHDIYGPMRVEIANRRASIEVLLAPQYNDGSSDCIHIEGDLDCILDAFRQVVICLDGRKKEAV